MANGKILSNPSDPKVLAIIQNIPIGAIFMMMPISFIIRLFNSSKTLYAVGVSSFNLIKIKPTSTPKRIMGNISPLVNAFNGFSGKIFKIKLDNVMLVEFDTDSDAGIFKPTPGLIIVAIIKERTIEMMVVNMKNAMDFAPIVASFRISVIEARLMIIEQKTRGTTSIFINLMNMSPPK